MWYCTHPGEREHDPAQGDPMREAEQCTHEECKPARPQLVLDATPDSARQTSDE